MINSEKRLSFKNRILYLLITLSLPLLAGCTKDDKNSSSKEETSMVVNVGKDGTIKSGVEYFTYQLDEGYKGTISINIYKNSGKIDLDIYLANSKEEYKYKGRDLDSASFDVIVDEPGEYKIKITLNQFIGDYLVKWSEERLVS